MKTAEQILTEVANEHSYETWGELMYDSHEHWQIHCTKLAIWRYAAAAIEEDRKDCAEKTVPAKLFPGHIRVASISGILDRPRIKLT